MEILTRQITNKVNAYDIVDSRSVLCSTSNRNVAYDWLDYFISYGIYRKSDWENDVPLDRKVKFKADFGLDSPNFPT